MLSSTFRLLLKHTHIHHLSLNKLSPIQSLHIHSNTQLTHNKNIQSHLSYLPLIRHRHTSHSHSHSHSPSTSNQHILTQHTKSSDFNHQPHGFTEYPCHIHRDNNENGNNNTNNTQTIPLLNTIPTKNNQISHNEILKILFHNAWPNTPELRRRSLIAISLMISSKLVVVSIPFWYKSIIDTMSTLDATTAIPIYLVCGYGISRALASLFREAQSAVFSHVTMSGTRRMAQQLFAHLHALDLEFHINRQTGLLSKAIDRGVRAVTYICNTTLINVLPTVVEVGLVCGILGYQFEDKSFLICTTATVGLYVLWSVSVTQYRTKLRQNMNKLDNEASAHVIDSLINYETVKYFNNEQFEMDKYGLIMNKYQSSAIKVQTSLSILNTGQNIIFTTGFAFMLYLACQGITMGTMSVGDLVLVNTLLFQLSVPLNFIGSVYREVKLALTDLESMMKLTHTQSNVIDNPMKNPQPLILNNGPQIEFKNVSFGYDINNNNIDDTRSILNNCSFYIKPGNKIAIVGGSGCGKSTILRLLYRFYDAQNGEILINGENIDRITLQSLREQIGIVPQDIVLFNDTLYNNIKYGAGINHEKIVMCDVINVCKQAQLHDFIMSLPEQYNTIVGERGLKLSGGEKQRVAISRMLLKQCKIIIMDEPTSSLDSATESDILTTINNIRNDNNINYKPTTMIIAHRLSTITDSDCILVLSDGKLVEQGTHNQLLQNYGANGYYKQLWDFQSNTNSD
eukprot:477610_1